MSRGDDLKDAIILSRQIIWQYQLESYTEAALNSIEKALKISQKDLISTITRRGLDLKGGTPVAVLDSLNSLTSAVRLQLTGSISGAATVAADATIRETGRILSFDGSLTNTVGFNFAALAPEQLKSMVTSTPIGGRLLNDWVGRAFESSISAEIGTEILAGYLKGEGIGPLAAGLTRSFGLANKEARLLARTYIADANNRAAKSVYDANADVIKAEEWNSTLEVNKVSGRGTCLRCAGLDGRQYPLDEPHIRPPLHVNCRCFMTPITKSYKELGLNIDELEETARPFVTKDGKRILQPGQFGGDFEDFLKKQPVKYQEELLGPNRLRLWDEGTIEFDGMVDEQGNVVLLYKDENNEYTGLVN